jgi:hypothetical protein
MTRIQRQKVYTYTLFLPSKQIQNSNKNPINCIQVYIHIDMHLHQGSQTRRRIRAKRIILKFKEGNERGMLCHTGGMHSGAVENAT